jgi:hypothetical protein
VLQDSASMKQSWALEEGHEIAPGRTVLKLVGGGNRYEVYLVWDERLFAPTCAWPRTRTTCSSLSARAPGAHSSFWWRSSSS